MAGNIFISYRREDEQAFAVRLYERLSEDFGTDRLFFDIDSIPPGFDFVEYIETQIALSDIVLVVIGRDWLGATDQQGRRRLDNPEDFVRVEIESALKQKKHVVPILVQGALMPLSTELPRKLQPLARRNAFLATHGGSRAEEAQLIKALQAALERREQERTSADARVAEEEKRRTQERPTSIETLAGPELSGRPDLKTTQGKELIEPERHGLNDAAQQQPGRQGAPVGETATASDRATGQNANLERHKDSDKELPPKRAPALSGQLSTKRDPSRISPPGTEHKGIFGESLDVNYSYYILRIIIAILAAASILIYFRLVVWNSETERLAATNLNYFIKSGVSFSELSDVKPTYGIEGTGVVVSSVEHGSTAEIAGVKSGFLLVSIGNKFVRTIQDLTSTVEDLTRRGEKRSMFGFRDPNRSGITVFIFVPLD